MAERTLIIQYNDEIHRCWLKPEDTRDITIGSSISDTVTYPTLEETVVIHWDGEQCQLNSHTFTVNESLIVDLQGEALTLYMIDTSNSVIYSFTNPRTISIGNKEYDDIVISEANAHFTLTKDELSQTLIQCFYGDVYYNFQKLQTDKSELQQGDQLFFEGVTITIGEGYIEIHQFDKKITSELSRLIGMTNEFTESYPDYHRSPRLIYREPEEKTTIAKPYAAPGKPTEQLLRIIVPPLVMLIAFGVVSIIQPRGIFIIIMLSMTVTTMIFSVIQFIKSNKTYRYEIKERQKVYNEYILEKTKELTGLFADQEYALYYHYPKIKRIETMVNEIDERIYEKTVFHHDFLTYRLGIGDVDPSFEIEFNKDEFTKEKDILLEQAVELHEKYQKLKNVPITTSLLDCPIGYIGSRPLVIEQLQLLVMQNAFFHSYHELQFITIFPEAEKHEWEWMRWLPHATLKELNVRGFVYHERSRDQVLTSLYQIIKERKQTAEEKTKHNKKMYYSPHYVVLITDEKIILDHIIMEFLNEDLNDYGVSLVFVQDVLRSLPEHVQTVIDIRDYQTGNVIIENGQLLNHEFTPDHFPEHFNKEVISRGLAPLNHLQSLRSTIPDAVTFLEMFGYDKVEQFDLTMKWKENETYKTMSVPLGLRGKDDLVYLNLHEKAHGPHGLVAGTTGSGKSEIIQSYILSLAVNFHPYEVAFLLIDYKGGGMANLFKDLPHHLGSITNLDGAQSMRALASIKAELERRQRLFSENNVNHINEYQKLFKQSLITEPMPHLFLISDEFAELKAEQPEFMNELVSTARIGRSLGIHLILATQKPSGVVDDQIWSNSKFKLALKVQDTSDSNEILRTPDAAEITLPGRAYLQVGNNEIYELFQSAWSGADYLEDKADKNQVDTTIYHINELGQYEILTDDLSGLDQQETIEKTKTELEAVIDYIGNYVIENKIEKLPSPWLPPLKEKVYLTELKKRNFTEEWSKQDKDLNPIIGFGDFPKEQDQRIISLPLSKDGHLLVVSSPGYGKSTFLQTIILDLARTHNPESLHVYLLDFGTNGLLPLRDLPHVADTVLVDDDEKIGKLIRRLAAEVKERKRKLSDYGVASIDMYEKASGEEVARIILTIDNYDSVREADFQEVFETTFTQLAREGTSIGIHLLISANRQTTLRAPLLSNIKMQLSLYMIDEMEVRSMIGRTELTIEEFPGRGLIKLDEAILFQTALPNDGEDTLAIIDNIREEAANMDATWTGKRPRAIPIMPEEAIPFKQFKEMAETEKLIAEGLLPLGLEFENVVPFPYDFIKQGNLLITADRLDPMGQLRLAIARNVSLLTETFETMILDTEDRSLEGLEESTSTYICDQEQMSEVKNDLLAEINLRKENKEQINKWIVFIANFKDFASQSGITEEEIELLYNATHLGIYLVICTEYSYINQSFDQVPRYVRNQASSGLVGMRLSDQDLFRQRYISNEKTPEPFECYFALEQQNTKLKVPK